MHFGDCVPVLGSLEWVGKDGQATTLALLQAQVENQGDAWVHFVEQLVRLLEGHEGEASETGPRRPRRRRCSACERLAQRIAELHVALGQRSGDPHFDPEPVTAADLRDWVDAVAAELEASMRCSSAMPPRPARTRWPRRCWPRATRCARASSARRGRRRPGLKTRIHGDLHLQQILVCRDDFLIIDFEGEPSRPIAERRALQPDARRRRHAALLRLCARVGAAGGAPWRTASRAAGGDACATSPACCAPSTTRASLRCRRCPTARCTASAGAAARHWERRAREAFLHAYWTAVVAGGLYQAGQHDDVLAVLDLFEIGKALYELRYEIDNRPDWIGVPLAGLAALAAPQAKPGERGRT